MKKYIIIYGHPEQADAVARAMTGVVGLPCFTSFNSVSKVLEQILRESTDRGVYVVRTDDEEQIALLSDAFTKIKVN